MQYDKAVKECSYEVCNRVLIHHLPAETRRKEVEGTLIGPYRIASKHSDVGYSAMSETDGKVARVHVNRLKRSRVTDSRL